MADVVAKFKLEDGSELPIGKSFISSLKSVSESTSDAGSINYGTLANSGSIEIQDGNGYISKMIDDGLLPVSDIDVNIEVNGNVFQQHITTDSDYNTEDNTLNISLSNFIKDFDILKYKGFQYPDASRTLYEIFVDVLNSYFNTTVANIDSMFDDDVLEYIKNIKIEFPYVEYGKTYREVIDSLCTIAQLNMFITKENKPKFISARPVYSSNKEIKQLTWNNIAGDLKYTKTLKNKFDGVEVSSSRPISEVFYDTVVYSDDALSTTNISQAMNLSEFNSQSGSNRGFDSGMIVDTKLKYAILYLSATKIKNYYVEGDLYINKSANDNLSNILKIKNNLWDSEGNPLFIIHYDKYEDSSVSATINTDTGVASSFNSSNLKFVSDGAGYIDQSISYSFSPSGYTNKATSTASETDSSYINVSLSGDTYKIHYKILCGQDVLYFGGQWSDSYILVPPSSVDISCSGKFTRYKPKSIEFSLYGNKREISFKEVSSSTENIENKKVKATVKPSSLLQTKTTYIGEMIANVIKQNILTDYRKGISDGKLILNKDLVEIGDLIKYPNDGRVWKVVGKELDYSGEYLFPISVMQCLKPYAKYGLFDDYDEPIYSWQELLERGLITISGNEISSASVTSESVNNVGNLKIPDDIVSVASLSFKNNTAIETFTMGSSLQTIKSSAFSGCNNLKNIKFSNSLKTIEDSAFNNTDITGSLIIPFNVSYIGNMCFWGCDNIKELSLPTGLTYDNVGASIIQDSINIEKMTFPIECCAEDGLRHYFGDKFFGYQSEANKNLNVPQSLKELVINGSGAGSITGKLFLNCNHLEKITIGAGVVEIRGYAFEGCSSIKEVYFEDPTGWKILGGTPDLTNPSKNAIMLTETYMQNHWGKE